MFHRGFMGFLRLYKELPWRFHGLPLSIQSIYGGASTELATRKMPEHPDTWCVMEFLGGSMRIHGHSMEVSWSHH